MFYLDRETQTIHIPRTSIGVTFADRHDHPNHISQDLTRILRHFETPHMLYIPQVLRVSREAEAAGGDDYAVLHNLATSLSLASSVLSAFSAYAVITRSARVTAQATAYQTVAATGLALCGVLLYGSDVFISAGGPKPDMTIRCPSCALALPRPVVDSLPSMSPVHVHSI